ncbi:TonB-dependent siderophore receptor [Rhodopseudomonas palustris HaA2]|uniref:TonB-dependent siderophore receptor n=1 Tax=Rhodopseudomonas palustris (strain HaA2) TaxID=316058 RepID=Q2J3Z6_RHOP2|nr:TonB-dependent siderophore receptor [Rhodopseudomonas palustris]ABD04814.1 TonB-dependent siderophore receptor [Rhodopseudomonas palustris HaA2]
MSPSPTASGRNRRLLSSVALTALLWPAAGHAQSAPRGLDPIVVEGQTARPSKPRAASSAAGSSRTRRASAPASRPPAAPAAAPSAAVAAVPTFNLGTMASTASRLGLTPLQTPASVDIITAQTIAERGQRDVLDAVTQNATGITATPEPGNGGVVFSTRGFSGTGSVMTLYDGTRLYVGAGTVTFPFDTWSAERIEVLRGPASVMYGEGAIGGAINVITKQPLDVQRNQAEVSLDTNLTRRIAVDSGGPINKDVSYRITATGNMSDGWVDRDKTSNIAVSAAVKVKQTDHLTWTLSTAYGDRHPSLYYGTPLVNGRLDESLRFKNYNVGDSSIRYQDSWTQLKSEWQVTDSITVRNALYYLNSRRHWKSAEEYAFNPTTRQVDRSTYLEIFHDQQQIGDRMDATVRGHLFGLENTFVAGFDVNRINFKHTNNSPYGGTSSVDPYNFDPGLFASPDLTRPGYSSVTNQYAVFAENRLQLTEQLALIGGIRQDQPTVERTDLRNPANNYTRSYSSTTWRAGAVYTPIQDLAFYGQYSTAVDPVGGLVTASNANAKFELATGKQVEIGVKQSFWGGRGEWTLAGYHIVKNNLLARSSEDPDQVVQVGQQSSRGIEASVGLALDHGWRVDANTTFLQAKYDDFVQSVNDVGVNFAGNVPINVPLNVSNAWLTWAFAAGWSANAGVQVVGKRFADAANTLEMPGYTLVNAGLQWKPDAASTLSLRLYNIFDKVYATSSYVDNQWLLGRPRTAELSYNVKF